ncbi:hypothetical protein DL764_001158 [Monosporascus ibericus]|uniref:Uncharacterized protein n=1 Tax=Monosporascus ibericus TaxID=155417 RepID=A0A4Q4TQL9_9PEZI|nr:hypothetical protein DL764_001158 [Monosporascus ibericus]
MGNQYGNHNFQDYPMHFAAAHATNNGFWQQADSSSMLYQFPRAGFTRNVLGESPLHRAAAIANAPATRYIIRNCLWDASSSSLNVVNAVDDLGWAPFWQAACANSREMVKLLLNADAFANFAGDEGLTPIHVAYREGQAESLAALLEGGVNPNLLTKDIPLLPSHTACIFGHALCLELLVENSAETISVDMPAEDEMRSTPFTLPSQTCRRDACSPDLWWAHNAPLPPDITVTDPSGERAAEEAGKQVVP